DAAVVEVVEDADVHFFPHGFLEWPPLRAGLAHCYPCHLALTIVESFRYFLRQTMAKAVGAPGRAARGRKAKPCGRYTCPFCSRSLRRSGLEVEPLARRRRKARSTPPRGTRARSSSGPLSTWISIGRSPRNSRNATPESRSSRSGSSPAPRSSGW